VSVTAGQTLLHYRLAEKIGEGGMGVVWRALDTTLDREVAIKILPEAFSQRSERIDRFEREAKILASLNHPNIASIFGLHPSTGSGQALSFLVMELVDGEDLAQRLERGPVPVREALEIAAQIAEALEAAHERGVIHRDLKPANIKVDPEDRAKVLDFGLAKAFGPETVSGDPEASPTLTSGGTVAGVILGTAAYMSPEQARGKAVDKRTDIWAFGCVLYEMLTGRGAFEGETVSDTVAAILKSEPDWSILPGETPAAVRRLLLRCLEKHPRERQHDIADARIVIREALARPEAEAGEPAIPSPPPRRIPVFPFAAGILVGAIAAALAMWGLSSSEPPVDRPVRKFQLGVSEANPQPAISPDGRRIVYIDSGLLRIRDLDRLDSSELPGTDGALFPFWSPDSEWVGFARGLELWKVPADGGAPMKICEMEAPLSSLGGGVAWGEGGKVVFTTGFTGLLEVSAQGGRPSPLLEPRQDEHDFHEVTALPDGRGFLFVVHGVESYGLAVWTAGGRKDILQLPEEIFWHPAFSPTGHILYVGDFERELWALPFSLSAMDATGEPFSLGYAADSTSVSSDATFVYSTFSTDLNQLVWVDPTDGTREVIGDPLPQGLWPSLAPDGKRVVTSEGTDRTDIWTHDLVAGTRRRLTFDGGPKFHPEWSPDGGRIAYTAFSRATLRPVIKIKEAEGAETVTSAEGTFPTFTPDGNTLVFSHVTEAGAFDVWRLDLRAGAEPEPLFETDAKEFWPRVSPDGRHLAYQSDQSGTWEVYVRPFPEGGGAAQVSAHGGKAPRWSADGRKLYFLQGDDVMEMAITAADFTGFETPRKLFSSHGAAGVFTGDFTTGYDVLGNGERFLMVEGAGGDGDRTKITVVEHWDREFAE